MASTIVCPKCGSDQLTANKKGFSGKQAVAGAILTGGIGILAGTLGSNKVKITCLACGKEFKPGEGRIVTTPISQTATNAAETTIKSDPIDQRVLELCQRQGKLQAIKFYKDTKGVDLRTSKDYVDKLAAANGIVGKSGCFIATACYGNYNSPEVLILRLYRDNKLLKTFYGKIFVKFYYFISPSIAILIAKSDLAKKIVKEYFLQPIIRKLLQ